MIFDDLSGKCSAEFRKIYPKTNRRHTLYVLQLTTLAGIPARRGRVSMLQALFSSTMDHICQNFVDALITTGITPEITVFDSAKEHNKGVRLRTSSRKGPGAVASDT